MKNARNFGMKQFLLWKNHHKLSTNYNHLLFILMKFSLCFFLNLIVLIEFCEKFRTEWWLTYWLHNKLLYRDFFSFEWNYSFFLFIATVSTKKIIKMMGNSKMLLMLISQFGNESSDKWRFLSLCTNKQKINNFFLFWRLD